MQLLVGSSLSVACLAYPIPELERWWRQPKSTVRFQSLNVYDGAMPGSNTFQPAVSKSPDGRLWFANDAVLQMINPAGLRKKGGDGMAYFRLYMSRNCMPTRKEYAIGKLIRVPPRNKAISKSATPL